MTDNNILDSSSYPGTNSIMSEWTKYWDQMKAHLTSELASHHVFEAVQYISTDMMGFLSNFTEDYQMAGEANVEKVLTQLQNLNNKIQTDFNDMSGLDLSDPTQKAQADKDALDAYNDYKQMDSLLKANEQTPTDKDAMFSSSFVQSIEQEFYPGDPNTNPDPNGTGGNASGTVFNGYDWNNDSTGDKLATYWNGLWNANDTSGSSSSSPAPTDPSSTQPVTNAFTAVQSQFASQSNTVNSEESLDESNDDQYSNMSETMMQQIISSEQQSTTAMQSAGS